METYVIVEKNKGNGWDGVGSFFVVDQHVVTSSLRSARKFTTLDDAKAYKSMLDAAEKRTGYGKGHTILHVSVEQGA